MRPEFETEDFKEVNILGAVKDDSKPPAIFVGQSFTRLVRGRTKYKVPHQHVPTAENPDGTHWNKEYSDREPTELEKMYEEFCEKAYKYLITHPTMQGANHPHRIIFPDFTYEVIDRKFPVI